MNVLGISCAALNEKFVEIPGVRRLTVAARKAAHRNAKAFPSEVRSAYWVGFVEGCTGIPLDSEGMGVAAEVAYLCGGIDGSAWA